MHSALRLLLVATMSGTPLALAAEPQAKVPDTGPMADMLKKIFGKKD